MSHPDGCTCVVLGLARWVSASPIVGWREGGTDGRMDGWMDGWAITHMRIRNRWCGIFWDRVFLHVNAWDPGGWIGWWLVLWMWMWMGMRSCIQTCGRLSYFERWVDGWMGRKLEDSVRCGDA